jgi:hypothetical protein
MKIKSKTPASFWDTRTKLLHLGLAIFVTFELLGSLVMQEPESRRPLTGLVGTMFEFHE